MSTVLFLSAPAHGNVNPTLGLVAELVKQGERVIYFSSETFRKDVEWAGAVYKAYSIDMDIFKPQVAGQPRPLPGVIAKAEAVIADVLEQMEDVKIDYHRYKAAATAKISGESTIHLKLLVAIPKRWRQFLS